MRRILGIGWGIIFVLCLSMCTVFIKEVLAQSWTRRDVEQQAIENAKQQTSQDEKIATLQKTVDINSKRITDLEHDVFIWKGSVLTFGTVVSFIELLQAFGLVRVGLDQRGSRRAA
jgi:uncharacterized membrane protein